MFTKLDNEFSETNWMNRIATKLMIQENYLSIHLFSKNLPFTKKGLLFAQGYWRVTELNTNLKGAVARNYIIYAATEWQGEKGKVH